MYIVHIYIIYIYNMYNIYIYISYIYKYIYVYICIQEDRVKYITKGKDNEK